MTNIRTRISTVLQEAYPALSQLHDDFFIIGSSALNLCGIEVDTADIDILLSKRDSVFLQNAWADKHIKDHVTQNDHLFHSDLSRFNFGELDIEIMPELEVNKDGTWMPLRIHDYLTLDLDGMQIKLPTLEEQKRIFYFFGREKDLKKIKLIEEWGLAVKSGIKSK